MLGVFSSNALLYWAISTPESAGPSPSNPLSKKPQPVRQAYKLAHRGDRIEFFFHRQVTQPIPFLQAVNARHEALWIRLTSAGYLRIMGFDARHRAAQGMALSISDRNSSRRVCLRLPSNWASKKAHMLQVNRSVTGRMINAPQHASMTCPKTFK